MEGTSWLAIYFPLLIVLLISFDEQRQVLIQIRKKLRRKEKKPMSNELIKSCIGKQCNIVTGSFGASYNRVTIVEVIDNWIKAEKNGKVDLINIDYVQNIKVLP